MCVCAGVGVGVNGILRVARTGMELIHRIVAKVQSHGQRAD